MQKLRKPLSVLLALMMVFTVFTVVPVSAAEAEWEGEGTDDYPYIISSEEDWNALATAYDQYDKSFKLDDDITVGAMIGTPEHPFMGHFDGDGHTLTFNLDTDEDYAAPFRYVVGYPEFRDLKVGGTINTGAKYAAGVVADYLRLGADYDDTTMTIENVRCELTINSSVAGDGSHGGIMATSEDFTRCHVNMNGCVFTGRMLGDQTTHCGGLVGYGKAAINLQDCVFAPEEFGFSLNGFDPIGRVAENIVSTYLQAFNSYYTVNAASHNYGRQICEITYDDHLDLGFVRGDTAYSVSGIVPYNKGVELNGKLCIGVGEEITVTPIDDEQIVVGVWCNGTELFPSESGAYTFKMPAEDVNVSFETEGFIKWDGEGTEASPYLIHDIKEWNRLRQRPEYNNCCFKLAGDIAVNTMIGTEEHPFTGSLDGDGHSITFNYRADHEYAAPFRYVQGGSFKDLSLGGRIDTNRKYMAGLIACQTGATTIENCFSDIEIYSSCREQELGYGGFVGHSKSNASVTVTGCCYDGKLIPVSGNNAEFNYLGTTGAFVGFSEGESVFTYCLCLPEMWSFCSAEAFPFVYGGTTMIGRYCYYIEGDRFSDPGQGLNAHFAHVGDGLSVDFGEATTVYDVSGIAVHENDIGGCFVEYKGEMIATEGIPISFTAQADDGYSILRIKVGSTVLTKDENKEYTFSMPDEDVTINGEFVARTQWVGKGTKLYPYIINSVDDWNKLVLRHQDYGHYYKLNADITIDKSVGSSEHPFKGDFNGNGHTITLAFTEDTGKTAPFCFVGGNTRIHDLKIDGSITTNKQSVAGIISCQRGGTVEIEYCRVSAELNLSYYYEGKHGGFVGAVADGANLTILGCVFDGKIKDSDCAVYKANSSGGFVGWAEGEGAVDLKDCLFMPSQLSLKTSITNLFHENHTFVGNSNSKTVTLDNCWYTDAFDVAQGTKGYTVTAGEDITLNFGQYDGYYRVVDLFVFIDEGLAIDCEKDLRKNTFGGTLIAAQGTEVPFTVTPVIGSSVDKLYANGEPLAEPEDDRYTLTVPAQNVTVTADLEHEDIVKLHSLTLDGDIGVNYYLELTEAEIEQNIKVSFAWHTKTKEIKVNAANYVSDLGLYKVTCNVSAPEMADEITAVITAGGKEVETDRYSVKAYAYEILTEDYKTEYLKTKTEEEYNSLATLVKTMLNYGAATQVQFANNHPNTTFANDDIDYDLVPLTEDELKAINMPAPDKEAINAQLEGSELQYYGCTMLLHSKTALRFYFLKERFYTDVTGIRLDDNFAKSYNDNYGYVEMTYPAYEMNRAYTLSFNGTELGSYSALTYIKDVLSDANADETLKNTVTAMYRYHIAAVDWFDNQTN